MKNFAAAIIFAIGACAAADTDVITGAEIHSRDTFKFGRFVASMRGPVTEGTVAELYTIQLDAQGDPDFNIYDPEQNYLKLQDVSAQKKPQVITRVVSDQHAGEWRWQEQPQWDYSKEWHKYEIEWTPEYIAWKVDDNEFRRQNNTQYDLDQGRQHLIIRNRLSRNGEPGFDKYNEEQTAQIELDYIEVYDYDGQSGSFNLNFRDDFDTLDPRWRKGDIQFMNTKYIPENVDIEDGKLIMKVQKEQDHDGSGSDQDSDDDSDSGSDSGSDDHSDDGQDFHVLPPPQGGTLDSAIEKTSRVLVTMVRQQLEQFSESMSHHLQ